MNKLILLAQIIHHTTGEEQITSFSLALTLAQTHKFKKKISSINKEKCSAKNVLTGNILARRNECSRDFITKGPRNTNYAQIIITNDAAHVLRKRQ